jgi:hypothetical protein
MYDFDGFSIKVNSLQNPRLCGAKLDSFALDLDLSPGEKSLRAKQINAI